MAKGHVHLNPIPPGRKKLLWVFMGISVALIGTGWILSTRASLSHEFSQMKDQIDGSIEQASDHLEAAEKVESVKEAVDEETRTLNEALDEAMAAYEELKLEEELQQNQ
jgi:hypothetical protein